MHNGVFVFTTERDLQLERVQLQIRKAPPGGREAWRRSTVAPEARATGRVSADQRNAALLLPPFRPAAPAHRSAMHTTAATVIGLPPTRALASPLGTSPETKTLLPAGPLETTRIRR